MGIKILFIVPYPEKRSPSQRFRFEQYFMLLQCNRYSATVSSFLNARNWRVFSYSGKGFAKAWVLLQGFGKRLVDLLRVPFYDFIFIHREAAPIGPPVFEWIVAHVFRKKIIYDFDDAIWLTDKTNEPAYERMLKWRSKVKHICRWSYKVSCSNEYLIAYALHYNSSVIYLPTTIDTKFHHRPRRHMNLKNENQITIGWTGSYSTLKYLQEVEPVLHYIVNENQQVFFQVVCDRKPYNFTSPNFQFVYWDPRTEIEDLLKIDIGIMPLSDDDWSKGKGGFKCLQYMALNIPTIASDVGVNSKIVDHGINGFLAKTPEEWKYYLETLIGDKGLRESMGAAGRKKVIEHYSMSANAAVFLSLFKVSNRRTSATV